MELLFWVKGDICGCNFSILELKCTRCPAYDSIERPILKWTEKAYSRTTIICPGKDIYFAEFSIPFKKTTAMMTIRLIVGLPQSALRGLEFSTIQYLRPWLRSKPKARSGAEENSTVVLLLLALARAALWHRFASIPRIRLSAQGVGLEGALVRGGANQARIYRSERIAHFGGH
jgi:hypothetical protein